ncbi:MAG TPA: hypothetical protein DIW31_04320 [Bacteroidales bacterium]|nr:hypothetical protein [Bacteroidales bacterium]
MLERVKAALHELTKKAPKEEKEEIDTKDTKEDSEEPWVEVVACGLDPIKGLHYELNWNDAFIRYLRQSGYTGSADETIVGKWMVDLWKQTSDELNSQGRNQYE